MQPDGDQVEWEQEGEGADGAEAVASDDADASQEFVEPRPEPGAPAGDGPEPAFACQRCSADLAMTTVRADVQGRQYCDACYGVLRCQPQSPRAPRFRCSVCGQSGGASHLAPRGHRLVCRNCLGEGGRDRQDAASPPRSSDPRAGQSRSGDGIAGDAPPDHAPETRRIAAELEGKFPAGIQAKITCPHCWHTFPPERLLWVSQHAELTGDPVVGADAPSRFRPSRFNVQGEALDARGMACTLLACPHCHLLVPRALVETEPLFFSIIGAPASGKSHFLAAMTWELRHKMPALFHIGWNDADPVANLALNDYEQTLFLQTDAEKLVAIRKTELQGELYDQITIGQQAISLPRPFLFTLRTPADWPAPGTPARARVLCLYDNAGEHFQPGMDTVTSPGTQHLARSRALLFLYDPTQHPKFRAACRNVSSDPQVHGAGRTQRQELLLNEAAARVRRYTGLSPHKKHDRPMVVVVSKADIWAPLLGVTLAREPILSHAAPAPGLLSRAGRSNGAAANGHASPPRAWLDLARVRKVSAALRSLLLKVTPEFVTAAEDFCEQVIYIPASALGRGPELEASTGMLGIRPKYIRSRWVTVPMLYMFAVWGGGLVPTAPPPEPAEETREEADGPAGEAAAEGEEASADEVPAAQGPAE